MKIRPGTIADLPDVQRLNKALFEHERDAHLTDGNYNPNWPYEEAGTAYFTSCLNHQNNQAAWIAIASNKTIGYLAASCFSKPYYSQNPVAEIDNMFVDQDHRSQGIGEALVNEFKAWARDLQATHLKVGALAANAPALAFYHRQGFVDREILLEMRSQK